MSNQVVTAVPFDDHRSTPLAAIGDWVAGLKQADVDYLWLWDELSGWIPQHLWTTENTPMAEIMDYDATHDPFVEAAFGIAADSTLNVRMSTDAIRSAPAELMRKLYSLQSATSGQIVLALGAGELRQTKPFGYKRSEGLARMEDILKLSHELWDAERPFDFEGNHWTFKQGYLGASKPARRPQIWALGGGPKLLDLAARYCDGFEAAVPQTHGRPEQFAEIVRQLKLAVEGHGRDPEQFGFGVWMMSVIHEDPDVLTEVVSNKMIRYFSGMVGRLNQREWRDIGLEPVMPDDWHYAMKWAPFSQTPEEIEDIAARTSVEMARRSYYTGSPEEVSKVAEEFVEAGATFVGVIDMVPLVKGMAEAEGSFRRCAQVAGAAKARAKALAGA